MLCGLQVFFSPHWTPVAYIVTNYSEVDSSIQYSQYVLGPQPPQSVFDESSSQNIQTRTMISLVCGRRHKKWERATLPHIEMARIEELLSLLKGSRLARTLNAHSTLTRMSFGASPELPARFPLTATRHSGHPGEPLAGRHEEIDTTSCLDARQSGPRLDRDILRFGGNFHCRLRHKAASPLYNSTIIIQEWR